MLLYLLHNRKHCRLNFYIAGLAIFAYFCENSGKYNLFHSYRKIYADNAKTQCLAQYRVDFSSLYATRVTGRQSVVLRRIGCAEDIGAIIAIIWLNYLDVCVRLHFCEFYCVLLYILYCFFSFFYLYRLSVCLYVSCLCLWALLPDLNKMMMIMMMMMITPKRYEIECQLLLINNRKSHTE